MPRLLVSPRARRNLQRLIETHSLPRDTFERFQTSIEPLAGFPLLGPPLEGRWSGYRYMLGPWRWMIVVYEYLPTEDVVGVVTVQDGRSGSSPIRREEAAADKLNAKTTPVRVYPHPSDSRANIPTAELESFACPE